MYNVHSYIKENGKIKPDGICWDYVVLVNPKIEEGLVEIPKEQFSTESPKERHFFFIDCLKKGGTVFRVGGNKKYQIHSPNSDDPSNVAFLDEKFSVGDDFYLIDPLVENNGGDKIYVPNYFLSFFKEDTTRKDNICYFFRDEMELISW
jgi:hypothetical protein